MYCLPCVLDDTDGGGGGGGGGGGSDDGELNVTGWAEGDFGGIYNEKRTGFVTLVGRRR